MEDKQKCTCCKTCEDCPYFQKVVNINSLGLDIYRYSTCGQEVDRHTGSTTSSTNILILHNTENIDINSEKLIPKLGQYKKCPRCKYILEHAEKLLLNITTINKRDILGICENCRTEDRKKYSACECSKAIKKFIEIKTYKVKEATENKQRKYVLALSNRSTKKDEQLIRKPQVDKFIELNEELCQTSVTDFQQKMNRFSKTIRKIQFTRRNYSDSKLDEIDTDIAYIGSKRRVNKKLHSEENISLPEYDKALFQETNKEYAQSKITYHRKSQESFTKKYLDLSTIHSLKSNEFDQGKKPSILDLIAEKNRYRKYIKEDTLEHGNVGIHDQVDQNVNGKKSIKQETHNFDTHRKPVTAKLSLCPKNLSIDAFPFSLLSKTKDLLYKDFSYFFINETERTKTPIRKCKSSSELIKDTQDMLLAREEELKKKYECNLKPKLHKDVKTSLAREEKIRPPEVNETRSVKDKTTIHKVKDAESNKSSNVEKVYTKTEQTLNKGEKERQEREKKMKFEIEQKVNKKQKLEKETVVTSRKQKENLEKKTEEPQRKDKREKGKKTPTREIQKVGKQELTPVNDKVSREQVKADKSPVLKQKYDIERAGKENGKEIEENLKQETIRNWKHSELDKKLSGKDKNQPENNEKFSDKGNAELLPIRDIKKKRDEEIKENSNVKQKRDKEEKKVNEQEIAEHLKQTIDRKKAKEEAALKLELLKEMDSDFETKSKIIEPREKEVKESKIKELNINQIKIMQPSCDDLILQLVKIKQEEINKKQEKHRKRSVINIPPALIRNHAKEHKCLKTPSCVICNDSELELDIEEMLLSKAKKSNITDIIVGQKILKCKLPLPQKTKEEPSYPIFKSTLDSDIIDADDTPVELERQPPQVSGKYVAEVEVPKGVIQYVLSDRAFIEKGWTMLPTEKVVRKMNVYRMRPAHPEFDWFEHNKSKKAMVYDSGEKLAEFDDSGRGRLYYRSGRLALDYYNAEEINAQQRFVIHSSGEPDARGCSRPLAILATFDYLGNGIVFDHTGKIRLKYNQTEGVVLDRSIGPVSHWKWHTLNDPPILQQVMIDTQLAHKDPGILKLGSPQELKSRPDNEEMLAIEFDNFIREKTKKLSQKFKPFQIKMKALKINEHFSLRVLDQATIYLIFRDGSTNIKLNLGMILDHQEIVDTDTAEVGEVSNSLERFPAKTDSLAGLQNSVAYAQRIERARLERERQLRPTLPCSSTDKLHAAASRPLRTPLRIVTSDSTVAPCSCRCRKLPSNNVYYDTRLL